MKKPSVRVTCINFVAAALATVTLFNTSMASEVVKAPQPAKTKQTDAFDQLTNHQQFARQQLIATIKLYDEHMRVAETGQYLDAVDTHARKPKSTISSIASTGIGLVSLTIGDQLGVIENAAEKAHFTLANLLNKEPEATFNTPRSRSGWYQHFINAHTGEVAKRSKEIFSTIDTALLGVGASMVGRYFEQKAAYDPEAKAAAELAYELVDSIDWGQAVRFTPRPGVHQIFRGHEERIENRFWSIPFDEYVIIPCLGRSVEARQGRFGRASTFWQQHLSDIANLPQAQFDDLSVLAVNGKRFTSHFTHQFAFYFCGDLASDPAYQAELNELKQADRKWFMQQGEDVFADHWWGLGAGSEIKFHKKTGKIKYSAYGVQRIGKNPNHTFSPAIMAGFLPVEYVNLDNTKRASSSSSSEEDLSRKLNTGHSDIISDLIMLYENDECRYHFAGLDFLWRCSARDTSLRVRHIEGVDLSTYMLGLAWFDPAVGKKFFDNYGVKTRVTFSEARERRAMISNVSSVHKK